MKGLAKNELAVVEDSDLAMGTPAIRTGLWQIETSTMCRSIAVGRKAFK